jgi:hypothetical protein
VPVSTATIKRVIKRHSDEFDYSRPKVIPQQRLVTIAAVREWFVGYEELCARHEYISTLVANFD